MSGVASKVDAELPLLTALAAEDGFDDTLSGEVLPLCCRELTALLEGVDVRVSVNSSSTSSTEILK